MNYVARQLSIQTANGILHHLTQMEMIICSIDVAIIGNASLKLEYIWKYLSRRQITSFEGFKKFTNRKKSPVNVRPNVHMTNAIGFWFSMK